MTPKQKGPNDCRASCGIFSYWGSHFRFQLRGFIAAGIFCSGQDRTLYTSSELGRGWKTVSWQTPRRDTGAWRRWPWSICQDRLVLSCSGRIPRCSAKSQISCGSSPSLHDLLGYVKSVHGLMTELFPYPTRHSNQLITTPYETCFSASGAMLNILIYYYFMSNVLPRCKFSQRLVIIISRTMVNGLVSLLGVMNVG